MRDQAIWILLLGDFTRGWRQEASISASFMRCAFCLKKKEGGGRSWVLRALGLGCRVEGLGFRVYRV
jgi:hypothetical protein